MSKSLLRVFEKPRFGNSEMTYLDVLNQDDAHSYIEALQLSVYQSAHHEYECSQCIVVDANMNENFGQGFMKFLPDCLEADTCPFLVDDSCTACLNSNNFLDKRSNALTFNPERANMDTNAFRESLSNRCSLAWTDTDGLRSEGGVTERFAEMVVAELGDVFGKPQPNFGMDFIVDCDGRKYNRRTCSSISTQEVEGVVLYNCMDAAEYLICLAPGVINLVGEFSIDGDSSSLSYDFNFNCEFFQNVETEMCLAALADDEGGSDSSDLSLDATCSSDTVMNCVESPWAYCEASSKIGDGNCDPTFNCRRHNFDGGDCSGWAPSISADANGDSPFCDCHGNCSPHSMCVEWQLPDCTSLYEIFSQNGECDVSVDCQAFSFDSGDCSTTNDISAKNSTANWLAGEGNERVLFAY
jgi:hypothetical protein